MSEQRLVDVDVAAFALCKAFCGQDNDSCVCHPSHCSWKEMKALYNVPTIDPETLPIVKELWAEIEKLNVEIADREQAGIEEHNIVHYWRDRSRELEKKLTECESVVHCKDCIHYDMGVCLKIYSDGNVSSDAWQSRNPNDFCSYGFKMDEEDN